MGPKIGIPWDQACAHPADDDPQAKCGARAAADQRCLAHLGPTERAAYLATLGPGSDVDVARVAFTSELLAELLQALRNKDGAAEFGSADFTDATFSGDANFALATFTGDALFFRVTFSDNANFEQAIFSRNARFARAKFTAAADFERATFVKEALFFDVTFGWHATFTGATLSGQTVLSGRAADIILADATVDGELEVTALARRVDTRGMRAQGRVNLRLRAAEVNLANVVCAGPLTVHALQQQITELDEATFIDRATGQVTPVRVVSLQGTDAEHLVLTDVDLSACMFSGLHRADQLRLDGKCTFATDPRRQRRVLAEEHYWRAYRRFHSRRGMGGWILAPGYAADLAGPARLEVLYRQLRKALEEGKNEPGAADFYYGEMEMRRAAARGGERALLRLYWLTSGYGLRAVRAVAALLAAVALLALAMQHAGFPGPQVRYVDALLYSLRSCVSVDVKSAAVPEEVTRWGQLIRIMLRIAGPLFLGLAALAIRNRVKR